MDTAEEELTTYLADAGIRGVRCKNIKAKNGRQFTTAASYVTCCQESRELFYDENNSGLKDLNSGIGYTFCGIDGGFFLQHA